MLLNDAVVIITGGVGLIGRGFVNAVLEEGGIGVIADIDEQKGISFRNKIQQELLSRCVDYVKLDITSKDSIQNMISYLVKRYGKIDAVVNCAYPRNKNYGRKFDDVEYSDFCENVSTHLGGYFLVAQQFGLFFKKQGYGNIINLASIYGVVAPRFEIYEETAMTMPVEYAAIKSAIIHLTEYMAKYFKGCNIRVNAISPGGILNDQPQAFLSAYRKYCLSKGMLNAADLVGALIFLLSDMSRFVNGQNIVVDDGFSL
jgi:NAD(P)-dependent dehydrogenase (short-subunit alcohol dehydrogenase family)